MSEYIEEDEIDLKELSSIIWRDKFTIALFTLLITSFTILYVLKKPNLYSSSTILILKENSTPSLGGGGAAAIAAMAGINIGGSGNGIDVASLFKNLLNNYSFHKDIIEKYNINEMISIKNIEKNFVFTANKKEVYDFFQFNTKSHEKNYEEIVFDTYQKLKTILTTSTDKKSGAITLKTVFEDRFVAKELIDIYLKEMSFYIKRLDLKEIDEQVKYYEKELQEAKHLDLKSNINELLSTLVKKKVLSQAGEFYMVKQLTKPKVAYIKDKSAPKRVLIIIVSFITSIILGIFFIFFKDYLKGNNTKNKEESELSF